MKVRRLCSPADILRLVSRGAVTVAYDIRILTEYREVPGRPKFGFSIDSLEAFLERLEEDGVGTAALPLPFRLPDPGDEPFLEVVLAARAGALVTGNKRRFPDKRYEGVKILSLAEFCASLARPAR